MTVARSVEAVQVPYPSATFNPSPTPVPPTVEPTTPAPAPYPAASPPAAGDGTFRYDGGPAAPIPQPPSLPQGELAPQKLTPQAKPVPAAGKDELFISLPAKPVAAAKSKYAYKAYGEK